MPNHCLAFRHNVLLLHSCMFLPLSRLKLLVPLIPKLKFLKFPINMQPPARENELQLRNCCFGKKRNLKMDFSISGFRKRNVHRQRRQSSQGRCHLVMLQNSGLKLCSATRHDFTAMSGDIRQCKSFQRSRLPSSLAS